MSATAASRWPKALLVFVLLVASLAAAPTDLRAATSGDCTTDCIVSLKVYSFGRWIRVVSKAMVPVKAWFVVDEDGDFVANAAELSWTTPTFDQTMDAQKLKPGTVYRYRYTVEDKWGNRYAETGIAITKLIKLTLHVAEIKVFDDSDDLSAGEFNLHVRAHNTSKEYVYKNTSISSGQTVHPNTVVHALNPPTTLIVYAELWDDDCDFGFGLCTSGTGPKWNAGSTSEADWTTMVKPIVFKDSGETQGPVAFTDFGLGPVSFQVKGTWKVEFF